MKRADAALLVAWYALATSALAFFPYLAVLLRDAGADRSTAAFVLLVVPAAHLVGAPLWTWVADRTGASHAVLQASTAIQVAAALALYCARGDWRWMCVVLLVFAFARSPQGPLADALTVELLGDARRSYGQIRAGGSAAFLVMVFLAGYLREHWPSAPLWLAIGFTTATALLTTCLPRASARPARPGYGDALALAAHPVLLPFLVVAVLHGITLTSYDNLFSLLVESEKLPPSLTGRAVATGVAVEVLVLASSAWLMKRYGAGLLLFSAVSTGLLRWWLTSTTTNPHVLVATQALHGIGFGAYWIAGVALLSELAPASMSRSAQSLLPAATFGLGYLVAMAAAGTYLRDHAPSEYFRVLTVVSAVATLGSAYVWTRLVPRVPGPPA